MTDLSFVRSEMLPQQAPPLGERGLVKWVRENLFSGIFNSVLTVIALGVLFYLLSSLFPWLANSMWTPTSIMECREILAATVGEGGSGACWGVVRERWHQWLFGFYPPSQYWRPILAFVLLFVALAPVLFDRVPKQLLYFTLIYPALCFWLLWGGSIWSPILVVVALVGVVGVFMVSFGRFGGFIACAMTALIFAMIFLDPFLMIAQVINIVISLVNLVASGMGFNGVPPVTDFTISIGETDFLMSQVFPLLPHITGWVDGHLPFGLFAVPSSEFGGFLLAITIGVTAIAFSLPFGILLALGRQSDMPLVKYLSVGFIEFIRGVPLITLLFTASLLLQYFLPPETKFDIILRVIILVTLFAAAYLAEVIRGGLAALPRGQYEAADALGLDYWRAQRLIILPQALKISIPSIVSTFIGLFKDTTLVSFVGLLDPLRGVTTIVRSDINWKAAYWEPYIFVGAIFFIICFGMSRYSMYLEQKLKTDRH
jgi:general L-amino acid transport system permease protein